MSKKTDYTDEELEIVNYIENENPKSVSNLKQEKKRYKQIFMDNINKRKPVNFRMLEGDLSRLKSRAISEGVPYQTLLGSIIHKYLNGNLVPKEDV